MQWFIMMFIASLVLYALRETIRQRQRRMTRPLNELEASNYYAVSLTDSVAVFLGIVLNRIGHHRAERWFLISFSVFGMLFKIFYTDSLFVMFTEANQNRINSIDQLFQSNLPITVDDNAINGISFDIQIES